MSKQSSGCCWGLTRLLHTPWHFCTYEAALKTWQGLVWSGIYQCVLACLLSPLCVFMCLWCSCVFMCLGCLCVFMCLLLSVCACLHVSECTCLLTWHLHTFLGTWTLILTVAWQMPSPWSLHWLLLGSLLGLWSLTVINPCMIWSW